MQVYFIDEVFICLSCLSAACGKSLNYNNKIKSDFCVSKAVISLSIKPVLNGANFYIMNLVWGIRQTLDKGTFRVQKALFSMFWECSPSLANLASDWLRSKRVLLWMRKK